MNEKEINLAILEELKAIAKRIFEKLAITPGTYTAAELAKEKDSNGNHIMMSWNDVINELYYTENPTVNVGAFRCTFAPQQIFRYVWCFEKLASVRDKEKVRFTKMKETEEKPLCIFTIEIEKRHLKLCKLVSKDELRPVMQQIYLDADRKCLVASDGGKIRVIPLKIESDSELPQRMELYIDPNHLKGMVGKNEVVVYPNKVNFRTIVTNCNTGNVFENKTVGRYPYYRNCFPKLRKDGYIRFEKKELKPIKDFCKKADKLLSFGIISLYIEKGSKYAILSYDDEYRDSELEKRFELSFPANMTIRIGLKGKHVCELFDDWNGGMWLINVSNHITMDFDGNGIGMMASAIIKNYLYPEDCKCDIEPFDRESYIEEIEYPEQSAPERPQNLPAVKSATGAEVIPFVSCLEMMAETFLEIAKESKQAERTKRIVDIVEILHIIGSATLKRPFGEAVVPIGSGGRKIPIPCKAVLRPHEELCGVDKIIIRTGGGNAPTAKEICLEATYLEQVSNPIGTIKIRGSPERAVTRLKQEYKHKKKE